MVFDALGAISIVSSTMMLMFIILSTVVLFMHHWYAVDVSSHFMISYMLFFLLTLVFLLF